MQPLQQVSSPLPHVAQVPSFRPSKFTPGAWNREIPGLVTVASPQVDAQAYHELQVGFAG